MATTIQYSVIRCLKGWQIEAELPGGWTIYSRIFGGETKGEAAARKSLEVLQGVTLKRELVFMENDTIDAGEYGED